MWAWKGGAGPRGKGERRGAAEACRPPFVLFETPRSLGTTLEKESLRARARLGSRKTREDWGASGLRRGKAELTGTGPLLDRAASWTPLRWSGRRPFARLHVRRVQRLPFRVRPRVGLGHGHRGGAGTEPRGEAPRRNGPRPPRARRAIPRRPLPAAHAPASRDGRGPSVAEATGRGAGRKIGPETSAGAGASYKRMPGRRRAERGRSPGSRPLVHVRGPSFRASSARPRGQGMRAPGPGTPEDAAQGAPEDGVLTRRRRPCAPADSAHPQPFSETRALVGREGDAGGVGANGWVRAECLCTRLESP